jgi:transposase
MEKTKRWIDDTLWANLAPLLPKHKPSPKGGRPRADDRACLEGILHMLRSGEAWHLLPKDYPSYPTCWRRLSEWTQRGVWPKLQKVLLQQLQDAHGIDWKRAVIDSASVRALFGGSTPAPARSIEPKMAANAT